MELRKELYEAIEGKLTRHGYMYIGNDILETVTEWIENHELFTGFKIVLDNKSKRQTRLTLEGFYETR